MHVFTGQTFDLGKKIKIHTYHDTYSDYYHHVDNNNPEQQQQQQQQRSFSSFDGRLILVKDFQILLLYVGTFDI